MPQKLASRRTAGSGFLRTRFGGATLVKLTNRLLVTLALPLLAYWWMPPSHGFAQATGVVDDPEAYAVYTSILHNSLGG